MIYTPKPAILSHERTSFKSGAPGTRRANASRTYDRARRRPDAGGCGRNWIERDGLACFPQIFDSTVHISLAVRLLALPLTTGKAGEPFRGIQEIVTVQAGDVGPSLSAIRKTAPTPGWSNKASPARHSSN